MYTIMWVDSDHHNTHSCVRNNLEDAIKVADKTGGHVYDENTDRVYPEEEHTLSYEDLQALNSVLIRRVPEILASTAKQKPVYTEKEVMAFWEQLEDVPMNPDTECMEEQFLHFPAGTPREDIWHWFDEIYPKGVYALLYGQN